ncbi:MAG: ParB/RepB/Spo0J family partition protein [Anaerolineae bacterium]|nr:ParB/RepB/Spo0J family partition protein [Anaerolineae bacterium]
MKEIEITYLNPRDLLPSRKNVRSDPGDLVGLAETIREHGILQPLGVSREGDAHRIVYGNRRRDAAIVVGLDRVPCVVLDDLDDEDVVVRQVLENLQRLDLNDLDKSRAFEELLRIAAEQGRPQSEALEDLARSLGLSARQIQRYLRLRQLSPFVQQLISQGEIGVTLAQHLVNVEPIHRQEAVAQLTVAENLSAAELARLCAALEHNRNIAPQSAMEMLRRGERIPTVEMRPKEEGQRLQRAPQAGDGREPPWMDEGGPDDTADAGEARFKRGPGSEWADVPGRTYEHLEPMTRDGNRVRRIHSLDAFMDEVQRLTQCVQEGDLQRLLEGDPEGSMKVRLAARQLGFLAEALGALAKALEPTS